MDVFGQFPVKDGLGGLQVRQFPVHGSWFGHPLCLVVHECLPVHQDGLGMREGAA